MRERVRFRGQSGHPEMIGPRQLLTLSVTSRPLIAALRKGYSITSSAAASRDCGTVRPSALAVLRLTTSSYLVGACTGRSAGISPLIIPAQWRSRLQLGGAGHVVVNHCFS
jgi:hypothetical protein